MSALNRISARGIIIGEGAYVGEAEYPTILRKGRIVGTGISPQWLHPTQAIFARGATIYVLDDNGAPPREFQVLPKLINRLITDGADGWAAWHGADDSWTWQIPTPRPQPPAIEYAYAGPLVCWIEHVGPRQPRVRPAGWAPWQPTTHLACPIQTPQGPWILRLEDTRLVAHPENDPMGYVLATGDTGHPHAVCLGSRITAVWDAPFGDVGMAAVSLDQPRIDLRGGL